MSWLVPAVGVCPNGWTYHDVSCYLFFHEQYTFFEAKVSELVLP